MIQEIIVYCILLFTVLHILHQGFLMFKPQKSNSNRSACGGGSCSTCAMKVDFDSIKLDVKKTNNFNTKSNQVKQTINI